MPVPKTQKGRYEIHASCHRLMVERSVNIIAQTCRGLQVAHERGVIHRDMKPSNIFVMDDDSVRIIDFGVVHKSEHHSTKGLKGTLTCSRLTVLVTCSLATSRKHGLPVNQELCNARTLKWRPPRQTELYV